MGNLKKLLLLAVVLLLCSCATVYKIGYRFNTGSVSQIIIGKTTQEEIVQLFGSPPKKGISNGKEIYIYSYQEVTFPPPAPFQNVYDVENNANTLVVEFDESKIVKNYYFNVPGTEPVIIGLLMQHKQQIDNKSRPIVEVQVHN